MKKSLITKMLLMIFVLAMVCCVAVACGDKTPPEEPEVPVIEPEDPQEALKNELVNIIKSINPIISTLNGVTESSTLSAEVGIDVDFDLGTTDDGAKTKGTYGVNLAANLDKASPQINLAVNMKDADAKENEFVLAYKDNKGYLKQPITKMNTTAGGADVTGLDLTELNPSILQLMNAAMYGLAGLDINIDFDALGESLNSGMLASLDLTDLISLTSIEGGKKLTIDGAQAKELISAVKGLIPGNISGVLNSVINALMSEADGRGINYLVSDDFQFPNLFIEAKVSDNALNSISVGIDYVGLGITEKENQFAKLNIDLTKFSTTDSATVECPTADVKSFNANVKLDMVAKNVIAELNAYATADMTTVSPSLVNGTLQLSNNNGTPTTGTVNAFFDGTSAWLDLIPAFSAVNGVAPANTFKASIKDRSTTTGSVNDNISMYSALEKSLINWNLDIRKTPVAQAAGLSLMQNIYKFLGGDIDALGDTPKRGTDITIQAKVDPTEEQIVTALIEKFGAYLVPTLGESQSSYKTYASLIDQVSDHFKSKQTKIKSIFTEDKKWAEVADAAEWVGIAKLYVDGPENDLLDIVNMFICNGDQNGDPYDINYLTNVVNRYIAVMCINDSVLNTNADVLAYKAALSNLDNEYRFWQNMYENSHITEAVYKEKGDAHYDGLKFDVNKINGHSAQYFANLVISDIFGYKPSLDLDNDNFLATFVNSGVDGKVFCKKGAGLNGRIELCYNVNTTSASLIKLSGDVSIVAKNQTTGVYVAGTNVLDLTDIEIRAADATPADQFKVTDTFPNGVKKLVGITASSTWATYIDAYSFDAKNLDGKIYAYDQAKDADAKLLWYDNYVNADAIIAQVEDLLENYKAVGIAS